MRRDLDDFTEFVAARSGALLRTAVLLSGGDRQQGEDLLQEALAETYRRWSQIAKPAAREAYTRKILVRRATQTWRRPTLRIATMDEGSREQAVASEADLADDVALGVDLLGYLRELPARQRAVVVLRYFDDLPEAEIARLLGCATGTVKSHASRALHTLHERLAGTEYVRSSTEEGHQQ